MRTNPESKFLAIPLALAAIAGLGLSATSAQADVIIVVDAPNDGNTTRRTVVPGDGTIWPDALSQTFDLSTDGNSAAGLSGTLTLTGTAWFEEQNLAPVGVLGAPPVTGTKPARSHTVFHGDYAGDLNGASQVAVWPRSRGAGRRSRTIDQRPATHSPNQSIP